MEQKCTEIIDQGLEKIKLSISCQKDSIASIMRSTDFTKEVLSLLTVLELASSKNFKMNIAAEIAAVMIVKIAIVEGIRRVDIFKREKT